MRVALENREAVQASWLSAAIEDAGIEVQIAEIGEDELNIIVGGVTRIDRDPRGYLRIGVSSDPRRAYTIPEGWTPDNIGHCRSCGAEVLWCITKSRSKAPLNRDGTSHFSNCPQADRWRRTPAGQ